MGGQEGSCGKTGEVEIKADTLWGLCIGGSLFMKEKDRKVAASCCKREENQ